MALGMKSTLTWKQQEQEQNITSSQKNIKGPIFKEKTQLIKSAQFNMKLCFGKDYDDELDHGEK